MSGIFEDWSPRQMAALNRATAWLRAMQPPEKQEEIIMSQRASEKVIMFNDEKNKRDNRDNRDDDQQCFSLES